MPVAAATIDQVVFAATFAAVDGGAEKIRAAVNDGLKGLAMIDGHGIGKAPDILRAVIGQNLLNRCHGQILSSGC